MPHSRIAIALAKRVIDTLPDSGESNEHKVDLAAAAIDDHLTAIGTPYLARDLQGVPTKDDLGDRLMNLRKLCGQPGSPIPLDHNFHWAIVGKMIELRGCICGEDRPLVTVDDGGSAWWVHSSECGLPHSPADGGPAPIEGEY